MFIDQVEAFTNDFVTEYGKRTLRKINSKIDNSRSVRKYFIKLQEINIEPHPKDLVVTIMNMPYFMVTKREIIAMASVLLLYKWHLQFNKDNRLASDFALVKLFEMVLNNAKGL